MPGTKAYPRGEGEVRGHLPANRIKRGKEKKKMTR